MEREAVKIAPSILSADFSRLSEQLASVEQGGADLIHVDVMDGHFVPNITFGPIIVSAVRKLTQLPLCVHLMISEPWKYAGAFCEAGADYLSFHCETAPTAERARLVEETIGAIREKNVRPGLAVNPETPLSQLFPFLELLDLVIVMSVSPGFGAQGFIADVLPKVQDLSGRRETHRFEIEVDGGVNLETAPSIAMAGATILAAGSFVFSSPDPALAVRNLRQVVGVSRNP
ncbi:MAG: ribulose-phosphate 3-epimerase [Candidatus Eiseniibacteriota bacterium]|nr:MAG: ribulose-phosphate 3-epimerase [Candidatus Eisenbacteria bacterium]